MSGSAVSLLDNKHIVLGVCGSIAVYKAVDLASKLTQAGANVSVIMTDSAREFVTQLTFQSVTGQPVYTSLWEGGSGNSLPTHIAHVGLGESADLLIIAPATANTIARLAAGQADDLLTVTALTARCPVLLAPAMDGGMYRHPATVANIALLLERGLEIIEPDVGRFASGLTGQGRLPDTRTLLGRIRITLGQDGILSGCRVVVTAGGTRESIDPVRFLTNHSSGKQGMALAQAAIDAGAVVSLISTARDLAAPVGAHLVKVSSAIEMCNAVLEAVDGADALLMAAAVADYRPASVADQKIKKQDGDNSLGMALNLVRTPDVLENVRDQRASTGYPLITVGFAAESQNLIDNATDKINRKGLDLIVANDISSADAGFRSETNRVTILDRHGNQEEVPLASKGTIAELLIRKVSQLLANASG